MWNSLEFRQVCVCSCVRVCVWVFIAIRMCLCDGVGSLSHLLRWFVLTVCRCHCWHCLLYFVCISIRTEERKKKETNPLHSCIYIFFSSSSSFGFCCETSSATEQYMQFLHSHHHTVWSNQNKEWKKRRIQSKENIFILFLFIFVFLSINFLFYRRNICRLRVLG